MKITATNSCLSQCKALFSMLGLEKASVHTHVTHTELFGKWSLFNYRLKKKLHETGVCNIFSHTLALITHNMNTYTQTYMHASPYI